MRSLTAHRYPTTHIPPKPRKNAPKLPAASFLRRGRGAVTCVAASNDLVLVATSRGWLLRYARDEGGAERLSEVEVVPAKHQVGPCTTVRTAGAGCTARGVRWRVDTGAAR